MQVQLLSPALDPAPSNPDAAQPHVVILGGGFGGLAAVKALRGAPVRVTLIDRRNHHVFQPLLYQVATAALSPAQIAFPIRRVLSRQANARVLLAEAVRIDPDAKRVILTDGEVSYDVLIVATGATHSYFDHPEWEPLAPGLKTIEDATAIRRRFLLAFERAERETGAARRREELTFVVVGAGPTGVEMAGAMIEIARTAIPRDFRSVDTTTARVVLVEAQDRVLPAFTPLSSARALAHLRELGVDVRLGARVVGIDAHGVNLTVAGLPERIDAGNVLWAAGVKASPLGAGLGARLDRAGRVLVTPELTLPNRPEVFVIGDLAAVTSDGKAVPGVAQGAMQMGRFVGRLIAGEARAGTLLSSGRPARPAFRYKDPGIMATIGRAKAVAELPWGAFGGFWAWLLWAMIHVAFLINFRTKIVVMLEWAWAYVVFERGARLITGDEAAGKK